jgi:chemotaxis protein MotB
MATFSDLVTLLLCFFVLLFAFAKTEEHKLQVMLGSLRKAFGGYSAAVPIFGKSPDNKPTPVDGIVGKAPLAMQGDGLLTRMAPDRSAEMLAEQIADKINDLGLNYDVEVAKQDGAVRVRSTNKLLFKEGTDEVHGEKTKELLLRISQLVRASGLHVSIEGHASENESLGKFRDAWDLSSARAVKITRVLQELGVAPGFLKSVAYGAGKPIKVDARDVVEQEKNNRVEFLFSRNH